jgi:hypothetical protein
MLRSVLLHVVKAAGPIDFGAYCAYWDGCGSVMDDVRFGVGNIYNRRPTKRAEIMGLAPGRGVKRGAVQNDLPPAAVRLARDDLRIELSNERVVVIQTLRHGGPR